MTGADAANDHPNGIHRRKFATMSCGLSSNPRNVIHVTRCHCGSRTIPYHGPLTMATTTIHQIQSCLCAICACTFDPVLVRSRAMKVGVAFGMCLVLFSMFGDNHGVHAVLKARREARELAAAVSALRAQNLALQTEAEAL